MAKKDKSQHDSNEVMKYYNAIWEEKCKKAIVDEKTKGYFAYISREVMASDKNSNRHKNIWNTFPSAEISVCHDLERASEKNMRRSAKQCQLCKAMKVGVRYFRNKRLGLCHPRDPGL